MSSSASLRIRWPPCCSSSVIPRARYVGDKVGRGRLEVELLRCRRETGGTSLMQRGRKVEKRTKSQRQGEPGMEVLVRAHDRPPVGKRAWLLFPRHTFVLGENVMAACPVF